MTRIFNLDNPVWNFLGKLTDMIVLTVLWVTVSIPVITAGASTAALYDISLQLAENQEGYIVRSFFRSFKKNWKKSTAVWMGTVCIGMFLLSDFYVYSHMEQSFGVILLTSSILLAVICLMTLLYVFPLIVRGNMNLRSVLITAFMLALKNLGWTIFMLVAAAGILAIGVFVMAPLLIIGVGLTAYLHAKILHMILKDYRLPEKEL